MVHFCHLPVQIVLKSHGTRVQFYSVLFECMHEQIPFKSWPTFYVQCVDEMFETQCDFRINTSSGNKMINFYQNSIQIMMGPHHHRLCLFKRFWEKSDRLFKCLMMSHLAPRFVCLAERLHFSKLTGVFLKLLSFLAICLANRNQVVSK